MNKRLLSVLAFALVVSVGASLILYKLISTKLAASAKQGNSQMVVANRDLEIGTLIKDTDLKTVDWSGEPVKGSSTNPVDVIGRGVVATINAGEPIVDTRLAPRGAGAGLAATIPPGMRAVAVRVNDVNSVSGFVVPGMRVDLLIAGNPPGGSTGNTGTMVKTLLQNIEVLSAGQNIQKDAEGKPISVPVVNVLATPEQAEILSLASNETRIQLVLRNPIDKASTDTPGTNVANLFTGQKGVSLPKPVAAKAVIRPVVNTKPLPVLAPAPAPEPPKVIVPLVVEVITGTSRNETKFKAEEAKP